MQRYSQANKVNRTKLTNVHRLGSRSIAYLVEGIRAQTEPNMKDYSFPTIQAYCKAWCREGPEYEPFRLHGVSPKYYCKFYLFKLF